VHLVEVPTFISAWTPGLSIRYRSFRWPGAKLCATPVGGGCSARCHLYEV